MCTFKTPMKCLELFKIHFAVNQCITEVLTIPAVDVDVALGVVKTVVRRRWLPVLTPHQHVTMMQRVTVKCSDTVYVGLGASVQRNWCAPQSRCGTAAGMPNSYVIDVFIITRAIICTQTSHRYMYCQRPTGK